MIRKVYEFTSTNIQNLQESSDFVASVLKSSELSVATTAARGIVPVDVSVQIVAQASDVGHVQGTIGSKEFFRH